MVRHDERMSDSQANPLLSRLDPLGFPARMRLLATETLRLAERPEELDAVLDEFTAGDAYQRELALGMARIAQRTDRLVAALDDPLYRIRVLALFACVAAPGAETDAAVLATLDDAPLDWRRTVTRAVAAARRTDLADRLAESYRDRLGESATSRLLATCSDDVAARLLPGLVHEVRNWGRIGAAHPALMLDFARRELAAMPPGSRGAWWSRSFADGLAAAAVRLPEQVLELLEDYPLPQGLPHSFLRRIHPLVQADEGRTLRLLAVSDGWLADRWQHLTHTTRRRLARSGRPEVVAVGRAVRDSPAAFAELLRCLPPSGRTEFYDAVTADQERDTAILAPTVLDALPRERRHAEARRMLLSGPLTDRPAQRLTVIARLPWDEAGELRAAVRRSDAEERAAAYPLLVACAAAEDRSAVVSGLVTGELGRLRNEQDPVRRAALAALAEVPARLFEDSAAVAEALGRLVTDAVEARDFSWATRDALQRLASRVLAYQVTDSGGGSGAGSGHLISWSLTAFEQLAGTTGALTLNRLDRNLRRGQELAVYRALEPWIARGMERADHRLVLALGWALGRRAWAIPGLQDALAHAIRNGTAVTARTAIDLWLADPAHRDVRVAEVLAVDPTAAAVGRVATVLSQHRTDLLDPYLSGGKAFTGKFIAKGAVWVPHFQPSHRWLPRQLAAYARLLAKIAADSGARVQERVSAIRGLGAIPGAGQRQVLPYLDSSEVPLAEAALGTLAWSEDPAAALPILLRYADGDRARVAVYAAGRAARFTRPSDAATALRSVALSPGAKVTSRKEALRIAADIDVPGLVDLLEEVWRVPGQHRDVKAAAAARMAVRMDDARVPALLREALTDDPAVAAQLLRLHPLQLPERHRAAYGELIAAACELDDPKASGIALVAAPLWFRWTDSVADAVCNALTDLDRRGDRSAPSTVLFLLLREGMATARYREVLEALLAADAREGHDGGSRSDDRDRPARRRLVSIAQTVSAAVRHDPVERRALLRATADTLTGHPGYGRLAADLAAGAVDLNAPAGELTTELLALADRNAGRCDAAAAAGERLASQISWNEPWDPAAILEAVEALGHCGDVEAGLIAAKLLGAAGVRLRWPGPYRLAVAGLRRHGEAAVAEAALDVDTGSA